MSVWYFCVYYVCFRECADRAVWLSLCLAVCWLMVIYETTNSISWLSTCGTWVTNMAFVTRAHRLVICTVALALSGKYNALTSLSSSPGSDSGVHQTSGAAGRHEPSLWHDSTSVSAVQSLMHWWRHSSVRQSETLRWFDIDIFQVFFKWLLKLTSTSIV